MADVLGLDIGDWLTALRSARGVRLELATTVRRWRPGTTLVGLEFADGRARRRPRRDEHWLNAVEMSRVAAENPLASPAGSPAYTPVTRYWSEQHGVRIQVVGRPMLETATALQGLPLAETE